MFYWVFKWSLFTPVVRLLWRPKITGQEHIPVSGPAVVVANHLSSSETFVLPAMMRRKLIYPAKVELFQGRGLGPRIVAWFLTVVGMLPMDRSGGRASATGMDGVLGILRSGELLGIFPEGTRSPDGRLHKGKTGVARLVLQADVPVIPVGFANTQWVRSWFFGIPTLRHPTISIGPPLEFSRFAGAANDRHVLRWVTDEIMTAVQQQSGQVYVDAYASSVKAALAEGREFPAAERDSPNADRPAPVWPAPEPELRTDVTA